MILLTLLRGGAYNLHDPAHTRVLPGLDLCGADRVQHIITAGWDDDLDYLDRDLSDVDDPDRDLSDLSDLSDL